MKKVVLRVLVGAAIFSGSFAATAFIQNQLRLEQPDIQAYIVKDTTPSTSKCTEEASQSDTTTLTNDSNVSVNETQDSTEQKGGPDMSKGFMYQLGNSTVTLNDAINMVYDTNRLGKMTGSEPDGTGQTWIPVLVDGQEAWCSIAHSDGSVAVFNNNGILATGHSN